MADNNKVTIDAAWFAELYGYKEKYENACVHCGECQIDGKLAKAEKERDELKAANEDLKSRVVSDTERKHFAKLEDEYIAASKERDELKARIDELENNHVPKVEAALRRANMAGMDADKRLAAAERCINAVWNVTNFPCQTIDVEKARNIIRAYRAQKEAK